MHRPSRWASEMSLKGSVSDGQQDYDSCIQDLDPPEALTSTAVYSLEISSVFLNGLCFIIYSRLWLYELFVHLFPPHFPFIHPRRCFVTSEKSSFFSSNLWFTALWFQGVSDCLFANSWLCSLPHHSGASQSRLRHLNIHGCSAAVGEFFGKSLLLETYSVSLWLAHQLGEWIFRFSLAVNYQYLKCRVCVWLI